MKNIQLPQELRNILERGKVTIRVKNFGVVVKPKENTIKDIIGKVKLKKKVDIENNLKRRFEHDTETY